VSKIKVEIEYIATNPNSEINEVSFPDGNNTSTGAVLNGNVNMQPLVWGASKWGDSAKFISKYNGFASEQCSNEQGEFSPPISFTITGTEIESLRIKFAASLGQYATELKVDGNTYINDSLTFITAGLTGNSHTVEIIKWSAPNFNARIDSIGTGVVTEYTERQIMELVAGNYSTANESEPAYGLISQYGNLTIKDIESEIKGIAQQQLLSSNSPIKITFKDEQQGNFLSDEWKYSINEVSVEFKDSLLAWQETNYGGRILTGVSTGLNYVTLLTLLNEIQTNYNIEFTKDDNVDSYIQGIRIPYAYFESGNLWEVLDKICKAGQLRLWQDKYGRYVISLGR
jgi:hypothetical protein